MERGCRVLKELTEAVPEGRARAAGSRQRGMRHRADGRRDEVLKIRVTAAERAAIDAGAKRVQLSTGAYLRALGLGHNPPSKVDLQAIRELGMLRADLGRLGGLLKLWLTDRAGEGADASTVAGTNELAFWYA